MRFQSLVILILSSCLWLFSGFLAAPALASIQIPLSDISYKDCPPELAQGAVTSDGSAQPANCFLVTGTANNQTGKTLYDADIFGRIYDANGEPTLQNRSRLGSIEEIPPGQSSFEMRISVPANQPTPLHLEKFKASGFAHRVRF